MNINELTERIIGAAIRVHRVLGPGLLESTYEACLFHELTKDALHAERQKPMPLVYDGVRIECGYRADLLIEGIVILELKAVERLDPVHAAQLFTYLKLSGCPVGLIINFNVTLLKDGVKRINYPSSRRLMDLQSLPAESGISHRNQQADQPIR